MWEQRYGFPVPGRTASGYRRYSAEDVEALRRATPAAGAACPFRAAIERARETGALATVPSIYAAVAEADHDARPQILRKSTLDRAEPRHRARDARARRRAGPVRRLPARALLPPLERRYQRLARPPTRRSSSPTSRAAPAPGRSGRGAGRPADALANEWAVIIDAPGYAACLLGWEHPAAEPADDGERRFEAIWTLDPRATRRAAQVAAGLAAREVPEEGGRVAAMLADRPLAIESRRRR